MPKYVYNCKYCEGNFTIVHGMTEKQDHCELCFSSECLKRIPQMPYIKTSDSTNKLRETSRPVGSIVKEAIEEGAKELKEQKHKAQTEVFDVNK